MAYHFGSANRRVSRPVEIGGVLIGGDNPIVVQSMTNTDTADAGATARQVIELAEAGSELVRLTVNTEEAAKAVPTIWDKLEQAGASIPLIGDFHYNGHTLLSTYPECAAILAKYRINPGNVGFREKRDAQFATMIEHAVEHAKPVRIGVNWGSLDLAILARLMDENAKLSEPRDARFVMHDAFWWLPP